VACLRPAVRHGAAITTRNCPPADPAKREAELKNLRGELDELDKASQKLYSIESMQRELRDLDTSLVFFGNRHKAPAINLSYDEKALDELREQAESDAIAAARKAEYRIVLSPYLSGDEFAKYATEYRSSQMGTAYMAGLKDSDDKEYSPVPQLRGCQNEVAAKNGTAYNFENNEAVVECVTSSFNMRSLALYGSGTGFLIIGMSLAAVRREWDDAVEDEKKQAAPAPAPSSSLPVTITVSTSQPVSMKPIRIIKRAVI
jgi:hypothetical protein